MHINRKWNGILAMVVALAMFALASCGAGNNLALNQFEDSQANLASSDDSRGLPSLPMDDDGVAGREISEIASFPGSSAIDSQNGLVTGTMLALTSTVEELAWGLYKVEGLQDRKVENVSINSLVNEGQEYSVGISNFSDGVWDFLIVNQGGVFSYDLTEEQSRLTSQLGNLFIVVITEGGNSISVNELTIDSRPLESGELLLPAKPRRLSVSEGLPDKIVVQWESVDGAENTEVWREMDVDGEDEPRVLIATVPVEEGKVNYTYEDTDILLGTEYKYSVRATNAAGAGAFSNEESGWAGATAPEGDDFEDEFEVRGSIEAITESSITVAGVEFLFNASTIWLGNDDEILTVADFAVGNFVEVDAERFGTDNWKASTVEMEDGAGGDEIKIYGIIEQISETSITVDGTIAAITEATIWLDGMEQPALAGDFTVGMSVELTLDSDGLGGWNARKVEMENETGEGVLDEVAVRGQVEEITADTITVDGFTASFNELTEWQDTDNNPLTADDFTVGMEVELKADADANGDWVARRVRMEDFGGDAHEIDVIGEIEFLDETTITVAGQSFNITEATIWLDGNKNPLTQDDFSLGMSVDVAGEADGNGGWDAVDVEMVN